MYIAYVYIQLMANSTSQVTHSNSRLKTKESENSEGTARKRAILQKQQTAHPQTSLQHKPTTIQRPQCTIKT